MTAFRLFVTSLLFVALFCGCSETTVSKEERAVVLSAEDFVPYGLVRPKGAVDVTWAGSRWFDGSKEIEYTYVTLDESEPMPFYLYVSVDLGTSSADAATTYLATMAGAKLGSEMESMERVKLSDSCVYGDKCALFLITRDDQPLGNQFFLQVGHSAYSVQSAGLYFDEPEVWHELIASKVVALKALRSRKR